MPLNGTISGFQAATAGLLRSDGSAIVLDADAERLYRVAETGVQRGPRLPDVWDAESPRILTEYLGGVWLCAEVSPRCVPVLLDDSSTGSVKNLGLRGRRRKDLFANGDAAWTVAIFNGAPLHRLSEAGEVLASVGKVRAVPSVNDSAVLHHGLGLAVQGEREILYAVTNPPSLHAFNLEDGIEIPLWKMPQVRPAEEGVVLPIPGAPLAPISLIPDTFPRTTGLARAGEHVWLSVYSPDVDTSVLLAFSESGDLTMKAEIPFLVSILDGSEDGRLLVRRRIDILEIAIYAFH